MKREGKSSAGFGISGQSGNVDEGQGSHTGTRRLVRTIQNPEVERSQVRRQEISQNSDSWKQDDQEESSNSTSTRRFVRAATPWTEFQNMKYTNHQYLTEIFHLKRSLESQQDAQLFSIKVAIHLGPNYLANFGGLQQHELRGNSELIQYHTEIDIGAF